MAGSGFVGGATGLIVKDSRFNISQNSGFFDGNALPTANNTKDFGSASMFFRKIFTGILKIYTKLVPVTEGGTIEISTGETSPTAQITLTGETGSVDYHCGDSTDTLTYAAGVGGGYKYIVSNLTGTNKIFVIKSGSTELFSITGAGTITAIDPIINATAITPAADGGMNLGSSTKRFYNVWASGIGLKHAGALPEAAVSLRGYIAYVNGGSGVADEIYICKKGADDAYHWYSFNVTAV